MEDNDIIKALRCCADRYCKGCSEQGKANCRESIAALAWDLIYRQKAEIKMLQKAYLMYEETSGLKKARAEAITEFEERLKAKAFLPLGTWCAERVITENDVDQIAKEMKEGVGE